MMRADGAERAVAALAASQHGAFGTDQAAEKGMTRKARRVRLGIRRFRHVRRDKVRRPTSRAAAAWRSDLPHRGRTGSCLARSWRTTARTYDTPLRRDPSLRSGPSSLPVEPVATECNASGTPLALIGPRDCQSRPSSGGRSQVGGGGAGPAVVGLAGRGAHDLVDEDERLRQLVAGDVLRALVERARLESSDASTPSRSWTMATTSLPHRSLGRPRDHDVVHRGVVARAPARPPRRRSSRRRS